MERGVHRIHLLHGGQQVGRAGDPGADLEPGPTHPPADLRADDRVLPVLSGIIVGRLGGLDLGPGVVHVLLGDGVPRQQRLQPRQGSPRVRQAGCGAPEGGIVAHPLQAVEHLTRLDEGPLGEGP